MTDTFDREALEKIGTVVDLADQTVVLVGHLPGVERYIAESGRMDPETIERAERELTRGDDRGLTSWKVQRMALDCTSEPGEAGLIVEGVLRTFSFRPDRIEGHRAYIGAALAELPHQFRSGELGGGGGWTFLNACGRHPYTDDNAGRAELWTGLQSLVETLIALGIAAGKAHWLMPREFWSMMPGGVPYVVVTEL